MKSDKESGRSGPLIIGSAAMAALAAWLALRDNHVPDVVRGTRAKVANVIRSDAGVNDAGARRAATEILRARLAASKSVEAPPPPQNPLTPNNALERARSGDLVAAQLIKNIANDKVRAVLGEGADFEDFKKMLPTIFDELGMTEDEYNTFELAIKIKDTLEDTEDSEDPDDDDLLDLTYGAILDAFKIIGPFGAHDPLLAHLLGMDEQGLRDLVQEAIGQNATAPSENRLLDEDIANLREWYGLD